MRNKNKTSFDEQITEFIGAGKVLSRLFWFTMPFVIMLFIAIVKMSYDNKTSMEVIKVDLTNHIKINEREFDFIKARIEHNASDCIVKFRTKAGNNG